MRAAAAKQVELDKQTSIDRTAGQRAAREMQQSDAEARRKAAVDAYAARCRAASSFPAVALPTMALAFSNVNMGLVLSQFVARYPPAFKDLAVETFCRAMAATPLPQLAPPAAGSQLPVVSAPVGALAQSFLAPSATPQAALLVSAATSRLLPWQGCSWLTRQGGDPVCRKRGVCLGVVEHRYSGPSVAARGQPRKPSTGSPPPSRQSCRFSN